MTKWVDVGGGVEDDVGRGRRSPQGWMTGILFRGGGGWGSRWWWAWKRLALVLLGFNKKQLHA